MLIRAFIGLDSLLREPWAWLTKHLLLHKIVGRNSVKKGVVVIKKVCRNQKTSIIFGLSTLDVKCTNEDANECHHRHHQHHWKVLQWKLNDIFHQKKKVYWTVRWWECDFKWLEIVTEKLILCLFTDILKCEFLSTNAITFIKHKSTVKAA